MTKVFTAQHPTEAHLVRGLLDASGIAAEVRGESLFATRGEAPATPDTLPTVWVVDDAQAEGARTILADYGRSQSNAGQHPAWCCPSCGEMIESQFSECWKCGAVRSDASPG